MRRAVASALLSAVLAAGLADAAEAPADLVIRDARVYTADAKHSMAQALAVRGGRIVYVGGNDGVAAFVGPATRSESAAGRLVLPGLIDSHIHATRIVDLDVCDLKSDAKSLAEMTDFVRGCIDRYHIGEGEWVIVRQWNYTNGNTPDPKRPTLRAALDLASTTRLIELLGNDGHHGAFNSLALARAANAHGAVVGFSKATLNGDLKDFQHLVGVDAAGEPNGTVNENARASMAVPQAADADMAAVMQAPERVPQRLNSVGITGILDPAVRPSAYPLYDALDKSGKLTVRASLAQFFDPDVIRTAAGQPDWDTMLQTARTVRDKYAHNALLQANFVKLFADGVLEGNPYATPPTPPEVAAIRPYLQPIFTKGADGKLGVSGYVDTGSALCADVRAHKARYDTAEATARFTAQHGYHPAQCSVPVGQLQHDRAVILEFVKRFHTAGFNVHIHAIGDLPVRTSLDAIEAARLADGNASTHDALAHVQLVHPDDVARAGKDHLYLAFTYAWAFASADYDLSVVPYFDRVHGSDEAALHPANGYYERNAYPVRSLKAAGATLIAGSDAPVDTRDPRPFINMAFALTRRIPGHRALNPGESITIREVIDAYTRAGAEYLFLDKETGSLETGKSADLIILDQDILALADAGQAERIAGTHVLSTYFRGRLVYHH